jgi:hypothetical protein
MRIRITKPGLTFMRQPLPVGAIMSFPLGAPPRGWFGHYEIVVTAPNPQAVPITSTKPPAKTAAGGGLPPLGATPTKKQEAVPAGPKTVPPAPSATKE